MTEKQLKNWERLANEATPGEWYTHEEEPSTIMSWEGDESNAWEVATHVECPDACFICAAREAVPALIARVRQLEAEANWLARHRLRCPWPDAMCTVGTTVSDKNECVQCWREAAREGAKND